MKGAEEGRSWGKHDKDAGRGMVEGRDQDGGARGAPAHANESLPHELEVASGHSVVVGVGVDVPAGQCRHREDEGRGPKEHEVAQQPASGGGPRGSGRRRAPSPPHGSGGRGVEGRGREARRKEHEAPPAR